MTKNISELVGKTIRSIGRSISNVTLYFSDGSRLEIDSYFHQHDEYDSDEGLDLDFYDKEGDKFEL